MIRTPTFTTPRLRLREVRRTDIPAYEKHFIDYEVVRYLTNRVPWPYPPDGVREYLDTFVFPYLGENKWVWAITERDGADELIGIIELWRPGRPEHRGFWLGRAYWGRGYMTEAVTPVMDFAFEVAGFERLVFANAVQNRRSARVKEKTGARLLGREPARFVDPAITEHELYELTREEWARARACSKV